MKTGLEFENSGMRLVCLAFYALGNKNVGLFQRIGERVQSRWNGRGVADKIRQKNKSFL